MLSVLQRLQGHALQHAAMHRCWLYVMLMRLYAPNGLCAECNFHFQNMSPVKADDSSFHPNTQCKARPSFSSRAQLDVFTVHAHLVDRCADRLGKVEVVER